MRGGRPWDPALRSTAAAGKRGKRERRPRGSDCPTHLGLRRSEEAWPRRRAEMADGGSGGGAVRPGRREHGAGWLVVAKGCAEDLFIGEERRWRGGGSGGQPASISRGY